MICYTTFQSTSGIYLYGSEDTQSVAWITLGHTEFIGNLDGNLEAMGERSYHDIAHNFEKRIIEIDNGVRDKSSRPPLTSRFICHSDRVVQCNAIRLQRPEIPTK